MLQTSRIVYKTSMVKMVCDKTTKMTVDKESGFTHTYIMCGYICMLSEHIQPHKCIYIKYICLPA